MSRLQNLIRELANELEEPDLLNESKVVKELLDYLHDNWGSTFWKFIAIKFMKDNE